MATQDEMLIERLNRLISICNDGKYGYETAAQDAVSPQLKSLFLSFSAERAKFADSLKFEVRKAGGDPDKGGDVAGALHRAWINVKSVLSSNDKLLLDACITGDKAAVTAYQEILRDALLPTDVRSHINIQCINIKNALKQVEQLAENVKA